MKEPNEETPDRRRGRLILCLNEEIRREAEGLVAGYADCTLEEVLAGLVSDMAAAGSRPGSWEAWAVCGWLESHPWPGKREGGKV